MDTITIALDAMGGDHGPSVVIPAALESLKKQPELKLILVGQRERLLEQLLKHHAVENERLQVCHASQIVDMDELPSLALRNKKDSSMRIAINLVKEGIAQACVSAGNTGALMATARFVLKTLPGIYRPAIVTELPTIQKEVNVRVLDLGANVDSSADYLFQFAVMGSVLASAVGNIKKPRVALLNIGEEEIKGNEQVKEAARLLSENPIINYIGYIEGDAIYKGIADVVVCDGFVGNVMLKTSEGLAKLIAQYLKEGFNRNWFTRLSGLAALRVLKSVGKRIDPAQYNGASLIGLQGTVIKSHGSANVLAYTNAIKEAVLEVRQQVPERIRDEVIQLLQYRSAS
ncbi:MAG: Phosphate acyltransferase [Legionellaceae bacterium]